MPRNTRRARCAVLACRIGWRGNTQSRCQVACWPAPGYTTVQHGKGAGIGAAFGGSSQTVFGSTGAAPFLAKLTAVAAILFMLTSVGLTILGRHQEVSVMHGVRGKPATQQKAPAPAIPVKPAEKPAAPTPPATPAK